MLKENTKAPDFNLLDQDGNNHSLKDYLGRKLILYFYPKDMTTGCTMEACGYRENFDKFKELGVEVVGISKDSVLSHKKFKDKNNLPFTLLSDSDLITIQDYDVYHQKTLYGKEYMGVIRTIYLIDENGYIIYASDKVKAKEDAINMLEVIKWLSWLLHLEKWKKIKKQIYLFLFSLMKQMFWLMI